jgi:hypothetical protein
MKEFEKSPDSMDKQGKMDNPEQLDTDKENLHDLFLSERHVDPIPMEDYNMEKKEETKRNGKSKDRSSSPKKYHSGFE